MALPQAEFPLPVAKEPIEGHNLLCGVDHGQDVSGEVGAGGQLDVRDHLGDVVHAVAPDQHVRSGRQGWNSASWMASLRCGRSAAETPSSRSRITVPFCLGNVGAS